MVTNLTEDEAQQLLRTVEMFEAITEAQPEDYQSLEILKEAYNKLGSQAESQRVSKRLAAAYAHVGQISQAILEYEGILQKSPNDKDVQAAVAALAAKTSLGAAADPGVPTDQDSKPKPPAPTVTVGAGAPPGQGRNGDDGDHALGEFLITEKLVTRQALQSLWQRLRIERPASITRGEPLTLVQLLVDDQMAKLEDILNLLVTKTNRPYLPLTSYDIDRDIVCLLPRAVCFQHCAIPFDLISRSVLIAISNPFDEHAREEIQAMLNYNVFWYIAAPAEIIGILRRIHGLESTRTSQKAANAA